MKTIKCAKCEKDVLVEDSYFNKCCPICLEKRKASYAVESADRDFDREAEKQLKSLFGENPPPNLSYGKMKEFYQTHFHRELTWEQYLRDIQNAAIHKIRIDSDEKVREIKGEKAKRIKYNAKFLDFELYPPSSRDQCKKFRHQTMGSYPQDLGFLEEHITECPECKMWNEVKISGMLNAEGTSEIWNEEQKSCIEPESYEDKFEKWEEEQGFKPCCLECGTRLVNGKCPNCQPNT